MIAAQVTAIALLAIVAFAALADAFIAAKYGTQATISAVIMATAMRYPALPLAVGFVLGHFFWPQTPGGAANNVHHELPAITSPNTR